MKPTDFFIGSRQLFGYIAPGAIWVCGWFMFFARENPVDYFGGDSWLIRFIFFVGLSYVVGYVLQTLLFWPYLVWDERGSLWPWPAKSYGMPPWLAKDDQLQRDVDASIPLLAEDMRLAEVRRDRVPKYCRNIALEYCTFARYRILELESEINFMVALSYSLPWLSLGWAVYDSHSWPPKLLCVGTVVLSLVLLLKRVPKLRRNEKAMWCEKYLILRARSHLVKV